jgi:hypothetical protein
MFKVRERMSKQPQGPSAAVVLAPPVEEVCLALDIPRSLSDVSALPGSSATSSITCSPSRSLAIGSFGMSGKVESLSPSPKKGSRKLVIRDLNTALQIADSAQKEEAPVRRKSLSLLERIEAVSPVVFTRALSSFLRVADLDMDHETIISDGESEESFPNYHHVSADPPPGVDADPNERWVVLDNGEGDHAPIAPFAIRALVKSGLFSAFDETMWTPDGKTTKLIKQEQHAWHACTWQQEGQTELPSQSLTSSAVLVWSGNFTHGRYGSELPAVRSAALIGMSAAALMDLLVDSSRVKEYNKMSLGREDLLVLQDTLEGGPFGGITKVMRSETKPPLVRKILTFTSILHCRPLDDGSGYKLVSRAVTSPCDSVAGALQSEILLSVNIIKKVEGYPDRCVLVAVNHLRSPMVPMMIAKRSKYLPLKHCKGIEN